ncbi:MAG: hypothetical protein KKH04_10305 [Proteobacteria bacterium]|nr:hypothetical protein [Pseudomonadota bacterium]
MGEQYASMIMPNNQQAIRSAKEPILDVASRTLDDALREGRKALTGAGVLL